MPFARFRLVVAAVCAGILFAGCSSGNKPSGLSASTSAKTSASNDPRSRTERDNDTKLAEGVLLRLADFPAGWQADTTKNDTSDDDTGAKVDACLGRTTRRDNPKAESPNFISSNGDTVSERIAVLSSVDAAQAEIDIQRQPNAPGCYQAAMKSVAEKVLADNKDEMKGAKIGDVSVNELSFAKVGDDRIAFRVTVPIASKEVNVSLYFDVVSVRVGRIGVSMFFQSTLSPFDVDEAETLVTSALAKVSQNAAPGA
jgi:hypothetical protein